MSTINKFPPKVIKELKNYVYRLIDPRNGETFYVGRGVSNRLYDHVKDELGTESDNTNDKLTRIREIRNAGFSVSHVIHRHGMSETIAREVEAALIDAYPGLTNIQGGEGSSDRGTMHADQIIKKYKAKVADVSQHKLLLISVNRSATEKELYEAVRFAWKLSLERAKKSDYVLAVERGVIIGVFEPEEWLEATADNFPGRQSEPDRVAFNGRRAPSEIEELYVGCRIPNEYSFGSGNPVRYAW